MSVCLQHLLFIFCLSRAYKIRFLLARLLSNPLLINLNIYLMLQQWSTSFLLSLIISPFFVFYDFFLDFAQKRYSDCVALNGLPMKTNNCFFMLTIVITSKYSPCFHSYLTLIYLHQNVTNKPNLLCSKDCNIMTFWFLFNRGYIPRNSKIG